jgi:hypothetical protein
LAQLIHLDEHLLRARFDFLKLPAFHKTELWHNWNRGVFLLEVKDFKLIKVFCAFCVMNLRILKPLNKLGGVHLIARLGSAGR